MLSWVELDLSYIYSSSIYQQCSWAQNSTTIQAKLTALFVESGDSTNPQIKRRVRDTGRGSRIGQKALLRTIAVVVQ